MHDPVLQGKGQSGLQTNNPRVCAPGGGGCPAANCNTAVVNVNGTVRKKQKATVILSLGLLCCRCSVVPDPTVIEADLG